jgi:hypothetical protein
MREHYAIRPLSEEDRIAGFRRATGGFGGSAQRWKGRAEKGMTDQGLAEALRYELGIEGGSGGDGISIWYKGAGLKIWISQGGISPRHDRPTFEGKSTIAMARLVYGIKDPADIQLTMF